MKIKLAILDKNEKYLKRIVSALKSKYADKLEIYSFTDEKMALSTINSARIDVLIVDSAFQIDDSLVKNSFGLAYLVDSTDIETFHEQRAVCRFQKVELIYKQVLSIYAESSNNIQVIKAENILTKQIGFISASGGAGCSTAAAACALYFAKNGKKVMYLNFEKLGGADTYFSGEGQFDMSDIIFALKGKKTNLSYKLQSCIKTDLSGVSFLSQSKIALDMMEIEFEDVAKLFAEIKIIDAYDYIIADLDFSLSPEQLNVYDLFDQMVIVSDGTVTSNYKTYRAYEALNVLDQERNNALIKKISIMYNKFSNKTCEILDGISFREIGGAPRYENASTKQVVSQLAQMNLFDALM